MYVVRTCEMFSCLLCMNSHASLTTSSSFSERCVDPADEGDEAFDEAVPAAAAIFAIV